MMDEKRRAEIRARATAARVVAPGAWGVDQDRGGFYLGTLAVTCGGGTFGTWESGAFVPGDALAPTERRVMLTLNGNFAPGELCAFLAATYADVPDLLDALDEAIAERDHLKRREHDIIEACEHVADGGQYRADIVAAIQRIRRERDDARKTLDEAAPTLEHAREKAIASLRTRKSRLMPDALAPWAQEAVDLITARIPGAVERFLGIAEGDVLDALCALRLAERREARR